MLFTVSAAPNQLPLVDHIHISACELGDHAIDGAVWNCNASQYAMHVPHPDLQYLEEGRTCKTHQTVVMPDGDSYMNDIPSGTGLKMTSSQIKEGTITTSSMGIHFTGADVESKITSGEEGLILRFSSGKKLQYQVYRIEMGGHFDYVPNGRVFTAENSCTYSYGHPARILELFGHTHDAGESVSVWRVSKDKHWTLIGKVEPNQGKTFEGVQQLSLEQNDSIAFRCTFNNTGDHPIPEGVDESVGEMCFLQMAIGLDPELDPIKEHHAIICDRHHLPWNKDTLIAPVPPLVDETA